MSKDLKNIAIVASATMGSRVLGLVRDALVFGLMGLTAINSAFLLAFTLPNLFRRLLGEGALTSALIPSLSHEIEEKGRIQAFRFLNQVFSYTLIALVFLVFVGSIVLASAPFVPGLDERWYLAADMGLLLLPYMILVCLAAVLSASLNTIGKFGVTSLSQVWLNLSIIGFLGGLGYFLGDTPKQYAFYLCGGVLVGGVIQVAIPALALMTLGWRPRFDLGLSPRLKELLQLLFPGLAAAAVIQVNIVVARLLAFYLNNEAVSVLYLANRLIELPMGVFTIAITTVSFPAIARIVARGESGQELGDAYGKGLRMIFAICIPAALGLIVLREPILGLLFQWGQFTQADVSMTAPILVILALGLPFYSLVTYSTRGFHAVKDMKTPFRISLIAFGLNLVLSVFMMLVMGIMGLALANVLVAIVQGVAQHILLSRKAVGFELGRWQGALVRVMAAGILMMLVTELSWYWIEEILGDSKLSYGVVVLTAIPMSIAVYFGVLGKLGYEDWPELKGVASRLVRI